MAQRKTAVAKQKKQCHHCQTNKPLGDFYASRDPSCIDGRMNICKDCVQAMCCNADQSIDFDRFRLTLKKLNKPFLPQVVKKCVEEMAFKNRTGHPISDIMFVSLYFKAINITPQYKDLTSNDTGEVSAEDLNVASQILGTSRLEIGFKESLLRESKVRVEMEKINKQREIEENLNYSDMAQMKDRFGDGFTYAEYIMMQKKYDKILQNYTLKTTMHEEFLIDFIKYKVKEETALMNNDSEAVKKWSALATTAADQAKLTPKQLTTADLQGGVNTIGEIFAAVEGAKDVIDILPVYKQKPNDIIDFNIYEYINCERHLNGMPLVSYEQIYKFYDDRKAEYLREHGDPFGIFANDMSQDPKTRETIKKFIKVDNADEVEEEEASDGEE